MSAAWRQKGWVKWDNMHIARMYTLLLEDADVWAAASIRLDHATNGGIQFKLSGYWELNERELDIIKPFWIKWKKEAIMSMWTTGFIASVLIEEPQTKIKVPRVLDLKSVTVLAKIHHTKMNEYKFFRPSENGWLEKEKQIRKVFWLEVGTICAGMPSSLMRSLHHELARVEQLTYFALQANKTRSQSIMVTQDQKNDSAKSDIQLRDATIAQDVLKAYYEHDIIAEDNGNENSKDQVQLGAILSKHVDVLNSEIGTRYKRTFKRTREDESTSANVFKRVRIGKHNLQRHVPPAPPGDLIEQINRKQVAVYAVFRVPASMVNGKSKLNQASADVGALAIFNTVQRAVDQTLLPMCKQLFRACCHQRALQTIADTIDEDEKESEITVSFPQMLPWNSMKDLYNAGFLTNDAMHEYIQARFGVAPEALTKSNEHKIIDYKRPVGRRRYNNEGGKDDDE